MVIQRDLYPKIREYTCFSQIHVETLQKQFTLQVHRTSFHKLQIIYIRNALFINHNVIKLEISIKKTKG